MAAELNKLRKLETKSEQRLLNHKQRFAVADWHRRRCEPGSEQAIYWMGNVQSALDGWLIAANQLLVIASRRCMAEQRLAELSGASG